MGDVSMFDGNKMTRSIGKQDVQAVKFWLDTGMNPNARDSEGNTALGLALHQRNYAIVELLLKYKADPNLPVKFNTSTTPLEFAVRMDRLDMIEILLQHGANPNNTNRNGQSPIDIAKQKGMDDAVELMQQYT